MSAAVNLGSLRVRGHPPGERDQEERGDDPNTSSTRCWNVELTTEGGQILRCLVTVRQFTRSGSDRDRDDCLAHELFMTRNGGEVLRSSFLLCNFLISVC